MACGGTTGTQSKRLTAYSSTQAIEWMTPWLSAVGFDKMMPALRGNACSSQYFEVQLVYQTAEVRVDDPDDPVVSGTKQTPTNGSFEYNPGVIDVSTDTATKAFVRYGVAYNYTSGQSQAAGDVELTVSYVRCGKIAGTGSWQLQSTTTSSQYQEVTGWIPSILVEEVKLAAICSSLTGTLEWRLAYRVAATTKAEPGAWMDVTDSNAPYTSGDINTGDLAVSLGSKMWVQFAIRYNLSSGTAGQANVAAAVGVRRA